MNELVKSRRFQPLAVIPKPRVAPAPLEAGPTNVYGLLFGGPLPASSPWINQGPYIQYGGGEVVGTPLGLGMGPGTINCQGLFINGEPLGNVYKGTQLYYAGAQGQTIFSLSTPDRFGNTGAIVMFPVLDVTVGGTRLALADGTGFGGYTINPAANAIVLSYPTGAGTPVIIDLYLGITPTLLPEPGGAYNSLTELVAVTAPDTFAPLTYAPDGQICILYVNRLAFFMAGVTGPDFIVTGKEITWMTTEYSVPMGSSVVAVYTYLG